jgi:hypothetical protein
MERKDLFMSKPGIFKSKILPTLVALILFLAAVIQLFVPLLGVEARAKETDREITERDYEEHPNYQYTWLIRYEYRDSKGNVHTGSCEQKGNSAGTNVSAPRSVYYLSFNPRWNMARTNDGVGNLLTGLLFLVLSIIILVITFRKSGKRKKVGARTTQHTPSYPNPPAYAQPYAPGQEQTQHYQAPNHQWWQCPRCRQTNQGRFCRNCGFQNPNQG